MGSNMATSHPIAGCRIGHRHAEERDAENEKDEVQHGAPHEAEMAVAIVMASAGVNARDVDRGPGINDP